MEEIDNIRSRPTSPAAPDVCWEPAVTSEPEVQSRQ